MLSCHFLDILIVIAVVASLTPYYLRYLVIGQKQNAPVDGIRNIFSTHWQFLCSGYESRK